MRRVLPPAGHPIPASLIFKMLGKNGSVGKEPFFFGKMFPGAGIYLVSSGTAALTLVLNSLAIGPEKREVIIPAYTCPSVAAAVIKNDLRPVLCDIHPDKFQFDIKQLEAKINDSTLAVVGVHLFGIPEDIYALKMLAEEKQVVFIEDACQAFGNLGSPFSSDQEMSMQDARQYLGTFGDVGILSFGRGKPLSLLAGGAVIINNSILGENFRSRYDLLTARENLFGSAQYFLKLMLYAAFFHPRLYGIPKNLPWLKLGETIFSTDFSVERAGRFLGAAGSVLLERFENDRRHRLQLAMRYAEALDDLRDNFLFMPNPEGDHVAFLRFPLVFKSNRQRNQILTALDAKGLGATQMYPLPLNMQEGIAGYFSEDTSYPGAHEIAEGILTLPLHSYVSTSDCQSICRIIRKHL